MAYGTFAGFVAYHEARGRDVDDYSETQVNGALVVATFALDGRYRSQFPGERTGGRSQENEWPRTGAYDYEGDTIATDETPDEVVNATYEFALQELQTAGSLNATYTPSKYDSVSVDGAVSVTYAKYDSADEAQKQFAVVDQLLAPILVGENSRLSGRVGL